MADDKQNLTKTVGTAIRQARQSRQFTQTDVADRVNMSVESYARIERGMCPPSLIIFARLVSVLGVSADVLLGRPPTDASNTIGVSSMRISAHSASLIVVTCALETRPFGVVSITTPGDGRPDLAEVRVRAECLGVLELDFDDVSVFNPWFGREAVVFDLEDAETVIKFAEDVRARGAERLIVHCQKGLSRSPAVAWGVIRAFGEDGAEFFQQPFHPNSRVVAAFVARAARARRLGRPC